MFCFYLDELKKIKNYYNNVNNDIIKKHNSFKKGKKYNIKIKFNLLKVINLYDTYTF